MESLGYVPNGEYFQAFAGTALRDRRGRLLRAAWETQVRGPIVIAGLGPSQELFGVSVMDRHPVL